MQIPIDHSLSSSKMNRFTLSFENTLLEKAYQRHFYNSHLSFLQRSFIVCLVMSVFLGLVEYSLFPFEHTKHFLKIRYFVVVPFILLCIPFFFSKRLHSFSEEHHQVIGIFLLTGGTAPLILLGKWILVNGELVLYFGLAFMMSAIFIYVVSRLRFLYAALIGWVGLFLTSTAIVLWAKVLGDFAFGSFLVFGICTNVICMFASYQMEKYSRKDFLNLLTIQKEQEKSERLLLNVLPREIAHQLKDSEDSIAQKFENATVLFADIVGFTPLAQRLEAYELVRLLNRIFSEFDALTHKYKVEKIKTIGDAYMAAAGVPKEMEEHAMAVALLALDMQKVVEDFREVSDVDVSLRIGIHSGPVVAGVIGSRKFIYDLWGDTVNTASRMESHGESGRIQVSQATRELLVQHFDFEERGQIEVKGKGVMHTWWLTEKRAPTMDLLEQLQEVESN